MSLIRLLTASRSWVGLSSEPVKYRMSDPRSMPKFGSDKHPFQAKPAAVESAEAAELDFEGAVNRNAQDSIPERKLNEDAENCIPASSMGAEIRESQHVNTVCGLANSGSQRKTDGLRLPDFRAEEPNVSQVAQESKGGWITAVLGLFNAKPRPARNDYTGPVQGELSLDKVKVVRNDLSDTDLEIVRRPVTRVAAGPETTESTRGNGVAGNGSRETVERVAALSGADRKENDA